MRRLEPVSTSKLIVSTAGITKCYFNKPSPGLRQVANHNKFSSNFLVGLNMRQKLSDKNLVTKIHWYRTLLGGGSKVSDMNTLVDS